MPWDGTFRSHDEEDHAMKRALSLTMLALLIWATAAPAAIPQTISYQGILREAGGTIVPDGDYNLTFKLYTVASGGTAIWTETQTLAVEDGVFNAILGSVTALAIDFTNPYWLGVAVGAAAELTPRLALTAGPYSLNADRLDGLSSGSFASSTHAHALNDLSDVGVPTPLDGQVLTYSAGDGEWVAMTPAAGDDGDWTINGDNIYHVLGKVGVGTSVLKRAADKPKPDGTPSRDPSNAKMTIYSNNAEANASLFAEFEDFDDASNGRAALFGLRNSGYLNPGVGFDVYSTNNAVGGANWYGDPYSFGVAGYSYFDGPLTGGVLGSEWNGNYWGALGYRDAGGVGWGFYTPHNSFTGGTATLGGFKLPAGGVAGKVLTSDAAGVGTWQDPAPDGRWTSNGDDIYRTLGKVGVGAQPTKQAVPAGKDPDREGRDATDARLQVYAATPDLQGGLWARLYDNDNLSNARAAVYATRISSLMNPGTNVSVAGTNNAITGWNSYGDPFSFGVAGYTYFDSPNTGGVLGCNEGTSMWGALAFRDASAVNWGLYTPYNAYVGGTLVLPTGNAIGGSGTANYLPRWTGTGSLGNSAIYQSSNWIGIGTTAPDRPLEVNNASGSALIGQVTYSGSSDYVGVQGHSRPTDYYGIGGLFEGGYFGVQGYVYPTGSYTYSGVYGGATGGSGTNRGFYGSATGTGTNYGIYSSASGGATNYAGYFSGNVTVIGTLSKSAGSFTIDHPLDPENKTLNHSFVESPDMMNVYNGNIVLGSNGSAWVEMPEWFAALNRDFRYQLTCIGAFAPVYVATEMDGNRFQIGGGTAGLKVSWQVTGIRQDAYANAHRIPVEELKATKDQGRYLNPEAFGQPETRGVDYEANHPELQKGEQ
jgi:hypothetical protein